MAVEQTKKISKLANAFSSNQAGNLLSSAIFTVASDGTIEKKNSLGRFLLNPSTWNESKSANWVAQSIPGQSDPILQWVNSGPRTISFQALVTAETSDFVAGQVEQPGKGSEIDKFNVAFAGIASAFFKTATPTPRNAVAQDTQLDISLYLNYYRSLLYPVYDNIKSPSKLKASPPLVVLYNGLATNKLPYGDKITAQHDLWVVTNLNIQITKQLPNLAPMEAVVDFQLTQYNIRSFDRNRFLL